MGNFNLLWTLVSLGCYGYLLFGDVQLKLGVLLLDVVVLHLHLMGELQPLLEGFWHQPLRLHLLLRSLQGLPYLRDTSGLSENLHESLKNANSICVDYLYEFLLGVFQPAQFTLGALSQLSQPVCLQFGVSDLILHLLLQVLLLHRHRPVLLLSLLQPGREKAERQLVSHILGSI